MLYIKDNYGQFITMMFSTLDRKPVTDQEARNNYKEVLLDYCLFLSSLSPLNIKPNSALYKQYQYVKKLDTLLGRYKNIGDEFLEDDKVEDFLLHLQNMMRDYLHQDLIYVLKEEEKKYYTDLAFRFTPVRGRDSEYSWQEEKAEMIKDAFQKHKELAFENLK